MYEISNLMAELENADADVVERTAQERGSLPVRLAMLGLAVIRKGSSPLWNGYPPGVFISYKWADEALTQFVGDLAEHLRRLGYRAFLDRENVDADADTQFSVPAFVASLQDCSYYLLLLTEWCADLMSGRRGKTSWIFDEYQQAIRLVNDGRLVVIPVLMESGGLTDFFTSDRVVDVTQDWYDFDSVDRFLPAHPLSLTDRQIQDLAHAVEEFDTHFLREQWSQANEVLLGSSQLASTFDHQFRRLLHSLYTADAEGFEAAYGRLGTTYGEQYVFHLYSGYCKRHGIPSRLTWNP